MNKDRIAPLFICIALVSLLFGAFFGCIGAIQVVIPGFLDGLPFFKVRPLHVTLILTWIFFSGVGGIYYYLPKFHGLEWKSLLLKKIHFMLFIVTGLIILYCYFAGKFGGREYWEFPPILAIPVAISWILFGVNYFKTAFSKIFSWPVYMWMWATGIVFFLFTFIESYLWMLPYFRDNHVRDLTMQWKSYGALTGSWNMIVYGTGLFIMDKIKGDSSISHSRTAFLMYFLGFINLLFGWAHHTYVVPMAAWIRYLAYGVSMTELLILAKIIINWRESLKEYQLRYFNLSYRFLIASDVWIFVNLGLAILISIPAVNLYTHGTHITVAHAMGSTIGINTMILLASCVFILRNAETTISLNKRIIGLGFWILNISFLVFWVALVIAGSVKGYRMIALQDSFYNAMKSMQPFLFVFAFSGLGILTGLLMIGMPLIKGYISMIFAGQKVIKETKIQIQPVIDN